MLVKNIAFVFALAAVGFAAEIDNNDIPQQCRSVCADVVSLAQECDRTNNDNDRNELNCICSGTAASQIPICEACVRQFDDDTDDDDNDNDNDVFDVLTSCSLQRTTYNSAQATNAPASSGSGSGSANPTAASTPAATTGSFTLAPTGGNVNEQSNNQQSTGAAAPMQTVGVAAGLGLGALGVVFGAM